MANFVSGFILLFTVACFAAQGSGVYFDAHVSRGSMGGDGLVQIEAHKIGFIYGDSIRYCNLENKKEAVQKNNYVSEYPVEFQYSVQYSFLVGYEKSFTKIFSLRGALGYQKVMLDARASTIPGFATGDMTEKPYVSAHIDRHWLSLPIDAKITLPIGRSGLYCAVGPKGSVLLSSTYSDSIQNYSADLQSITPGFNFGIGVRLGAEFPITSSGYLFIESGYYFGLLNTSIISSGATTEGEYSLFGAGFRLNL